MDARVVALLTLAPALAGCLSSSEPLETEAVPTAVGDLLDLALPFALEHEHDDAAAHAGIVAGGFQELAVRSAEEAAGGSLGTTGEIDIQGDYLFQAALQGGFLVYDITDRANPVLVGTAKTPEPTYGADIKASPDANFVFLGVQAAAGTAYSGVVIYDVSDKADPRFVSYTPRPPRGCHMLSYKDISGVPHLFCSGSNAVAIFELRDVGGALTAVPASTYFFQGTDWTPAYTDRVLERGPAAATFLPGAHDMTVQDDPVDGNPILVVSYFSGGLRVVDVSNPRVPRELGSYAGEGSEHYQGGPHTGMVAKIGDRRVVVWIPEYDLVPAIYLLDATDWGRLTLLSEWTAVEDYGDSPAIFSTHNFQIIEGKIVMAQYHAGVWVVDISTEDRLAAPEPLGYFVPVSGTRATVGPFFDDEVLPNVWDVAIKDGYIYASDIPTGLHVLSHAAFATGDATLTSFA